MESSEKSFSDVKGMDEILSEFQLVVELLQNPERFREIGAKTPKGILLNGPPGTGKTLIAKAIAGEGKSLIPNYLLLYINKLQLGFPFCTLLGPNSMKCTLELEPNEFENYLKKLGESYLKFFIVNDNRSVVCMSSL